MPKKLTYEYVKNYIESFKGYKLLSEEYKTARTNLKIQCQQGHIFWMRYDNFKTGNRCFICAKENRAKFLRLSYQSVKNYIESFKGYRLLSEEYKNAHNKLKLQCQKNHIFETNYNTFQRGRRCPVCSKKKKLTNQEIIETLKFCESIRETEYYQIEVKCTYCGEWHIPKRSNLTYRILYINGDNKDENRFYCSQNCKYNCPIFNRNFYPRGYALSTSREVQPELRQLVFERDNYICQKCNKHKDELYVGLHCHHKYPLNESPIESADIDTCITLCEDCHK